MLCDRVVSERSGKLLHGFEDQEMERIVVRAMRKNVWRMNVWRMNVWRMNVWDNVRGQGMAVQGGNVNCLDRILALLFPVVQGLFGRVDYLVASNYLAPIWFSKPFS